MIAIIDYGVGNLFSISRSLSFIGMECVVTDKKSVISSASHIVLPGVGAFGDAIRKLEATGLLPALYDCIKRGIPLLGVCLGMQLLFEKSHEYGEYKGLGLLKGEIYSMNHDLKAKGYNNKIPHMGWNALNIKNQSEILKYTKTGDHMYFVHSFYAKNCEDSLTATVEYGIEVPAVVTSENVYGCQFHPEKSGDSGLKILKAFGELR